MQDTTREAIQEYSKTHTLEETEEQFPFFCVAPIWDEVQTETETSVNQETEMPSSVGSKAKVITLKIYADNERAIWEYDGLNEDGSKVECKGEIKSREFAVKLAQRAAQRCNEFKCHLVFEHGRQLDTEQRSFTLNEMVGWGDLCLSPEALEAVENELRQARYQGGKHGLYRNYQ